MFKPFSNCLLVSCFPATCNLDDDLASLVSSTTMDETSTTLNDPLANESVPEEHLPSQPYSPYFENMSDEEALLELAEEYANSSVNTENHLLPNKLELTEINLAIKELWEAVDDLKDKKKPQTVEIHNFNGLKTTSDITTVKDKVNALFFEALIPLTWKISVTWTENPSTQNVDTVTITLINHHVKDKVVEKLKKYFEKNYENVVYI
jgi:hypothetical protein